MFLFWPQYGTLLTVTQLPFPTALLWVQDNIPLIISDFLPWHVIHEHRLVGKRHCCGLLKGWGATLEIEMQLDWGSPLGCRCPQSATGLTSALPSHYSPKAAGGQRYQVKWCYKINWTLCWGKCWRWWTERVPAENTSSFLKPPSELDWLQGRTAGLLAGAAIGIKHERPGRRWASVTRHFLRVGDATCARPVRLSEIGLDTPECTGVVSELQMEAMHGGKGSRCGADTRCRRHRAELLSQYTSDYSSSLKGFWELYSQLLIKMLLLWFKNKSKLQQQPKCSCHWFCWRNGAIFFFFWNTHIW